jgi:Ca2+-binding EF-hand superfamily protein
MAALSEAEVSRIRELLTSYYGNNDDSVVDELFRIIDRDGSGSLEPDELQPIIAAVTGKEIEAGKIEEIIKAADSDGNSTIEPGEFKGLLDNERVKKLLTE